MHEIVITTADAGRRLDKFLFAYLNNAPHSLVYKLLRKKRIKLNGKRAQGSELLQAGNTITLHISNETLESCRAITQPEKASSHAALDIVYEDGDLLIINKPAGIPSHGGMKSKDTHLLSQALSYLRKTGAYPPGATFTPALCNRLDVNTSGLVICGKNYQAIRAANTLFATPGNIDKEYLAIVDGELSGSKTLEGRYKKDTAANKAHITQKGEGVPVITAYKSLAAANGYTLISINPITGRSHQIRAHMAAIGHPLAGDKKYGGKPIQYSKSQLLHCRRLTIAAPSALPYPIGTTWEAAPPENFTKMINERKLLCQSQQL